MQRAQQGWVRWEGSSSLLSHPRKTDDAPLSLFWRSKHFVHRPLRNGSNLGVSSVLQHTGVGEGPEVPYRGIMLSKSSQRNVGGIRPAQNLAEKSALLKDPVPEDNIKFCTICIVSCKVRLCKKICLPVGWGTGRTALEQLSFLGT